MSKYDRPDTRSLYLAVLSKTEPSPLLPESDDELARARNDSTRATSDSAPGPESG